jgi:hypothetical protein
VTVNMLKRYPGLRNVPPEHRLRTLKQLLIQDRHSCYLIAPHVANDHCWGEHRPSVPGMAGNYCDKRYIRSPYCGDENWKLRRHWKKLGTYA